MTLKEEVIRVQREAVVANGESDVMPIVRRGRFDRCGDELKNLGSIRSEHRLRFQGVSGDCGRSASMQRQCPDRRIGTAGRCFPVILRVP